MEGMGAVPAPSARIPPLGDRRRAHSPHRDPVPHAAPRAAAPPRLRPLSPSAVASPVAAEPVAPLWDGASYRRGAAAALASLRAVLAADDASPDVHALLDDAHAFVTAARREAGGREPKSLVALVRAVGALERGRVQAAAAAAAIEEARAALDAEEKGGVKR